MDKIKKEMLEKLRNIKQTAEEDLEANNFKDYDVKNVIHYNEKVELINKKTNKKEQFDLYVVITENTKAKKGEDPVFEIEYLENKNGVTFTIADLIHEYDGFENIKDVVDKAKENEEKPEKEQDEELKIDSLEELEAEKEKEECAEAIGEDEENIKNVAEIEKDEDAKKLENMRHLQEIDADTKVNYYKDMERALKLRGVEKFVIVYSEDAAKLSETKERNSSRYSMIAVMDDGSMLNLNDRLEEIKSEGKNSVEGRIQTGADEKTTIESTPASMYRIKGSNEAFSFENGEYGEIKAYYGNMTVEKGTTFVGTQLETRNVWPTSKEVREQASDRAGKYYADDKKEETEKHIEHGDDKVSIENSDGQENTIAICDSPYIPGTEKTWQELSDETGESVKKLQERFEREFEKGKESQKILEEIEYDYAMLEHEQQY